MYHDEIILMGQAVDKAVASLLDDASRLHALVIDSKGKGDLVSEADRKSERIIIEHLQQARPDWGFLGEEGGRIVGADPRFCWIIDPLDGTSNFLQGLPLWNVTIALEKDGQVVAGMTYNPITQERFHAIRGEGFFKNDKRINKQQDREMNLEDALVLLDLGHHCVGDTKQKIMRDISEQARTVRILGSGALSLAYVAMGSFDAAIHTYPLPWDLAAGFLFVEEAGFTLSGFYGEDITCHHDGGIVIARPSIYDDVLRLVKPLV